MIKSSTHRSVAEEAIVQQQKKEKKGFKKKNSLPIGFKNARFKKKKTGSRGKSGGETTIVGAGEWTNDASVYQRTSNQDARSAPARYLGLGAKVGLRRSGQAWESTYTRPDEVIVAKKDDDSSVRVLWKCL